MSKDYCVMVPVAGADMGGDNGERRANGRPPPAWIEPVPVEAGSSRAAINRAMREFRRMYPLIPKARVGEPIAVVAQVSLSLGKG